MITLSKHEQMAESASPFFPLASTVTEPPTIPVATKADVQALDAKKPPHIATKHLVPWFGDKAVSDITRQEVQAYVAHLTPAGYAPKTIDHIHDVLSAVLRTAVKWGHVQENAARGVDLPTLKTVRPKWVLTTAQATASLAELPPLARTMTGVAMLTGLRRGELFALRCKAVDLTEAHLTVQEAVYEGAFGSPKTQAGIRRVPLSEATVALSTEWRRLAKRTEPDALVFSTWFGKPISPNNVSRRWVFPACTRLGLPNATWLTFRRTYASRAHDKGVPGKVVAQLMGHTNADVTLNVYTHGTIHYARRWIASERNCSLLFTPGRERRS